MLEKDSWEAVLLECVCEVKLEIREVGALWEVGAYRTSHEVSLVSETISSLLSLVVR